MPTHDLLAGASELPASRLWRSMQVEDLDGVVRVARTAFPAHYEARACFEERLRLFAPGCFSLAGDNELAGYLIAYPWPLGSIPPLNSLLGKLPRSQDHWYLHDLALLPEARGHGHARAIVDIVVVEARRRGATSLALVSVNGTRDLWRSFGFVETILDPHLAQKLASYGDGSAYMIRDL